MISGCIRTGHITSAYLEETTSLTKASFAVCSKGCKEKRQGDGLSVKSVSCFITI